MARRVGLLAADGALKARLYQDELARAGLAVERAV
jgi:aspartate/glutamate racemase